MFMSREEKEQEPSLLMDIINKPAVSVTQMCP